MKQSKILFSLLFSLLLLPQLAIAQGPPPNGDFGEVNGNGELSISEFDRENGLNTFGLTEANGQVTGGVMLPAGENGVGQLVTETGELGEWVEDGGDIVITIGDGPPRRFRPYRPTPRPKPHQDVLH